MIKVIINGCNGKMGRVLQEIIAAEPEMEIAAGIDITENSSVTYPIFPSVAQCSCEADVVIDFTIAKIVDQLLDDCVEKKLPLVLCTTGLTPEQLAHVEEASKQIPIVQSYNMSLGINTLAKILESVAPTLADAGFDIEIIEKHHNQKIDAPSGTALLLANTVNASLNNEYYYQYDRTAKRAARDKKEIGISAIRGGTIVGEHSVIFAGQDEVLELTHEAHSKAVFAKGAVQAAKFLVKKQNGRYTMRDVIA
ncbi:MAG TPA: 4-hydroxy-tetrahydrodipicolinate reductase [Candidatus Fimimorpha faecalis]|uniref:4-hydroxy-tetrahydrodipicolinate reductase n=1 Tax=Candidatus Fimimorpha faecalis TaxID=2840824 RepID=A0A9D1EBW4_9FIRM|nr:4-hydroxy-tetrahydrodipicolinate reductase [Candidatus Fimimorpha faecalis]